MLWFPLISMWVMGCSLMPSGFEAPHLTLVSLSPKEMTFFEQQYEVELRIQNPNDTQLSVTGLRFDLELNNRIFANGMSGDTVVVPRFDSETIHAKVISTAASFIRQIQEVRRNGMSKVMYRLRGTAFIDAPARFRVPFDEQGEFDFSSAGTSGADVPPP